MPRTFYTERDIQDLARQGVTELEVNDSVHLTELALEMMDKVGMRRKVTDTPAVSHTKLTDQERAQVIEKVKSGVLARLGPGVDATVVDTIVRRVVDKL